MILVLDAENCTLRGGCGFTVSIPLPLLMTNRKEQLERMKSEGRRAFSIAQQFSPTLPVKCKFRAG
jgi:hypothetical protein